MTYSHVCNPTPNPSFYRSHFHNEYEILYFCQGDADYIMEGSVYHLRQGDLLFIKPRMYHHVLIRSVSTYERFVINFSASELDAVTEHIPEGLQRIYNVRGHAFLQSFFDEWRNNKRIYTKDELDSWVQSGVKQILLSVSHMEQDMPIQPVKHNRALEEILTYIEENPHARITAETLATKYYVSTSWIVHTFQKQLGLTLMQYVTNKRILYAQQLIRGGMSPTEAAEYCSFDSYITFYRQYKRILNKTPKEDKK
ncbi:MAG: AraC family transcriptional regulator [Ruminococcaceae bacterium]|nr:AraC family transcriptional regulator [Oscillospiraceae bacterium]